MTTMVEAGVIGGLQVPGGLAAWRFMLPDKFFTVFHLSQVDRRGAMSMEESARVGDESGLDVGESFCELAARGPSSAQVGGRGATC